MFLTNPEFIPVRDREGKVMVDPGTGLALFTMSESLRYVAPNGTEYVVPAFEPSDMGSIAHPVLRAGLSPHEVNFRRAFRLHDYLYNAGAVGKVEADMVFHAAMREEGCDFVRANAAFLAVLAFGWGHYRKVAE